MKALIIYGQLRTANKCIDNILNFIEYEKYNHDIFLFINKNDKYYSEQYKEDILSRFKNINLIIIAEEPGKGIDLNEIEKKEELERREKYFNYVKEIKENFPSLTDTLRTSSFLSTLYYRRQLILQKVKKYCYENNIIYDKCILTRFDYNVREPNSRINYNLSVCIQMDNFFCSDLDTLIEIFNFSNIDNYFYLFNYFKSHGYEELKKLLKKYDRNLTSDENIMEVCRIWLAMPECNFNYFLREKNIQYHSAGPLFIQR